ncbi:MAG: hypothetical protein WDO73_33450 [Ignavibacteriota bacterium]
MRNRRWIVVLWACFLARLLFYSVMMPLWEGYDEWAHFAVVRQMVFGGHLLVSRDAPIPRDVETSLQLAPVPWELRSLSPPSVTHDDYWALSGSERARRQSALHNVSADQGREDGSGALKAYEALQPPLYYWIMAPALWLCRGLSLLGQVMALRVFSSLVASCIVPLVFLIGLEVWREERVALGCAAIVTLMPELAIDVARVGNDCLAVVLFTLLTWLVLKASRPAGAVLGLGLLTKAYFLTAIPFVWGRKRFRLPATCLTVLLSAWWYIRNLRTTGTLSGLSESVMLRGMGTGEMIRKTAGIDWAKAIDAIFLSHLYFGGWSSLTVRSWMYHVFYMAILAAAIGLARVFRQPPVLTLLLLYLCFWLGQFYNVAILYLSKGLAGSMGWYMYAVVGAEVTLCVAGLRGACTEARETGDSCRRVAVRPARSVYRAWSGDPILCRHDPPSRQRLPRSAALGGTAERGSGQRSGAVGGVLCRRRCWSYSGSSTSRELSRPWSAPLRDNVTCRQKLNRSSRIRMEALRLRAIAGRGGFEAGDRKAGRAVPRKARARS